MKNSLLPEALLLQTSYENSLDKYNNDAPVDNLLELALRAERNFCSNCLLITGIPVDHQDYPPDVLKI